MDAHTYQLLKFYDFSILKFEFTSIYSCTFVKLQTCNALNIILPVATPWKAPINILKNVKRFIGLNFCGFNMIKFLWENFLDTLCLKTLLYEE